MPADEWALCGLVSIWAFWKHQQHRITATCLIYPAACVGVRPEVCSLALIFSLLVTEALGLSDFGPLDGADDRKWLRSFDPKPCRLVRECLACPGSRILVLPRPRALQKSTPDRIPKPRLRHS